MRKLFLLLASLSLFSGAYAEDEVKDQSDDVAEVVQDVEEAADECCSEVK